MKKTVKKALALVLSFACVLSSATVFAAKTEFSDIKADKYSWARGYIEDMAEKGFISGYDDGTYKPDNSITRLEGLSLFARAMGSQSEANAEALKRAEEKYLPKIEKYGLKFGKGDIAYLLYRGALKESELDTYLKDEAKNQAMPRYEAAIIITKAMCQEANATSEIMIDLEYSDAKDIPTKASHYVYYVTKNKIMQGKGDGKFAPKSSVLRSEVAVMLSKTVDLMSLTVEELKLASIDNSNIGFYNESGKVEYMGYNKNTKFFVEGVLTEAGSVPAGVDAIFTYVNNEVVFVDIEDSIPDQEIEGIYKGSTSANGLVSINVKVDGEDKQYAFGTGVVLTYKDKTDVGIKDFKENDFVKFKLVDGKIQTLYGEPKVAVIKDAVIDENNIIVDGTITISHSNNEYDGMVLKIDSDVEVRKNGSKSTLEKVYQGDTVTLTLEYGTVSAIEATSKTVNIQGTIKVVEISANPKITLTVDGKDEVFAVTPDIKIIVNDKEASFYDFRLGDNVLVTVESEAIKKITVTSSAALAYSQTGRVTSLNAAYGFIKIAYNKNDVTVEETVYCKDATTKFITSKGDTKALKDVKEGDVVSVRGTMSNGAFEATLIIIEVE